MLVEAGIIGFLSFWVANEYMYNAFFRTYINQALVQQATTYSIALGLGIGVAGTTVAALFYKNLQQAKVRLESSSTPKIKATIEKVLSTIPTPDAGPVSAVPSAGASLSQIISSEPQTEIPVAESKVKAKDS